MSTAWIEADWPAPGGVRTLATTRHGGVSAGAWSSCNLGMNCGDDPGCVMRNRKQLDGATGCFSSPCWLQQVHGTTVIRITGEIPPKLPIADAAVTSLRGLPCAVLSADCLPILLCSVDGAEVAAIHAGWRGLAGGIIAACLRVMHSECHDLMAWLGPAIGPGAFMVGPEVKARMVESNPLHANAFRYSGDDRFLADIYQIARNDLEPVGVAVYGGHACTVSEPERFFSYRRDGVTGRMASLIWMENG